jgi:hypothetical protein
MVVREAAQLLLAFAAAGFGASLGFAVKNYLEHKRGSHVG